MSIKLTNDGRGYGLFTEKEADYGECVASEMSYCLWISQKYRDDSCSYCMKHISNSSILNHKYTLCCTNCNCVKYCSRYCQENDPHIPICKFYIKGNELKLSEDQDSTLQLIAKVYWLYTSLKLKYKEIMRLSGDSIVLKEDELAICRLIAEILVSLDITDVGYDWIVNVFKKDKACGFAVMQPPHIRAQLAAAAAAAESDDEEDEGEGDDGGGKAEQGTAPEVNKTVFASVRVAQDAAASSSTAAVGDATNNNNGAVGEGDEAAAEEPTDSIVRGFGVYPLLGMTNHSCVPNCVRWDNFDADHRRPYTHEGIIHSLSSSAYMSPYLLYIHIYYVFLLYILYTIYSNRPPHHVFQGPTPPSKGRRDLTKLCTNRMGVRRATRVSKRYVWIYM